MQIAIVCVVRNEVDLIDDFLSHHLAIADCLYVIDHLSNDGTYEIIRSRAQNNSCLVALEYNYRQFFQGVVMTAVTQRAIHDGADWIVPLDADEFLPYSSKHDLLQALLAPDWPLVRFFWQNLVPHELPETSHKTDWSRPFLTLDPQQTTPKVAVARDLALRRGFAVDYGSHGISFGRDGSIAPKGFGTLLHIPIRSRSQALKKYETFREGLSAIEGFSGTSKIPFVFGEAIKDGLSLVDIQSLALRYPAREVVDVVDQAIPYFFKPNQHFTSQDEVPAAVPRAVKSSRLTKYEARAAVVGRFVIVRPRRFWRLRRAAVYVQVRVRWLVHRLRRRG